MKLPNLDDLIEEQMVIFEHPTDEPLFVAGPPGSGKTTLAIMRANFLKNAGQQVCLITKNKMLAELARQLGKEAITTDTMNSFVSAAYSRKFGANIPQSEPFDYKWDDVIAQYEASRHEPKLDHLVVDEGQNLPRGFFRWAIRFAARTVTVFADEDQTTDPARSSSSLRDIVEAGLPDPKRLTENHRNTPEIAAVAEHFHRSEHLVPGRVRRDRGGNVPRLLTVASWNDVVSRIVARLNNRRESIGLIVYTKRDVMHLEALLRAVLPTFRVDHYTSDKRAGAIGIKLLEEGVTVLSGESAIGLEFDTAYLHDLARSLPCRSAADFRRMYMLCARAKHELILLNGPPALDPNQVDSLPAPPILER